jgi:catechol O-methyltransferase
MDVFWDTYFNGSGTAEWNLRSSTLDSVVSKGKPQLAVELGTYCGYTAVRVGRLLPPGAQMISIEVEPLFAAIASKVVEHAGLRDVVRVEIGSLEDRLASLSSTSGGRPIDTLLLDHKVSEFLPDLQLLEGAKLISPSTAILCDWNLYPGSDEVELAPQHGHEFMDYLKNRAPSDRSPATTMRTQIGDKDLFTVTQWMGAV